MTKIRLIDKVHVNTSDNRDKKITVEIKAT